MANALVNPQQTDGPAAQPQPAGATIDEAKDVIKKQATIDKRLRRLLEKGGPVARKDVVQVAVNLVAERVVSAQTMAGYLADLPEDPDAVREWVEKHAVEAENQLSQLLDMLHGIDAPASDQPAATGMPVAPPA